MKMLVLVATLTLGLPFASASQLSPIRGERIRIRLVDGVVLTGTLANLSTERILLTVDPHGSTTDVPVERVKLLERSLGQHSRFGKYFGVTVGVSSLVTGLISAIAWSPCYPECGWFESNSRRDAFAQGAMGGALLGVPIGVLAGLNSRKERWARTALPDPGRSRVVLLPVLGVHVGFVASVRVGPF